jgi:hypothetical protein
MFDDLRESDQPIFKDEQVKKTESILSMTNRPVTRKKKGGKFLGMTAIQRFILSILLFLSVCIVGIAVLFVTGRLALPL